MASDLKKSTEHARAHTHRHAAHPTAQHAKQVQDEEPAPDRPDDVSEKAEPVPESSPKSAGYSAAQAAGHRAAELDAQPDPEPAVPSLAAPDPAVLRGSAASVQVPFFAHPNRARLNLYLLRHASAGTRRANLKIDVKRPLDKEGKRHCLQLAHVLNGFNLSFDLIVSSPLKRCLQTAQLIGTETGYEAKILHAKALEPDASFAEFHRLVHECRTYENVLMVGHNPTMTYFLGELIGQREGEDGAVPARVRLRKGSIARVTLDRGPAVLQWLLDPRIVRALYDTSTKSSRRKTSRK